MKLHSPKFERGLRRSVRKTVRRSRELRRERRASRRHHKHYQITLLLRPAVSLVFAFLVWQIMNTTGHASSALAAISLWGVAFVFIQAQRLLAGLFASSDLGALMLLPVPESTVFRWELQKCLLGSLWLWLDLLAAYTAMALYHGFTFEKWPAVLPISALTWAQVLALAMLAVCYLPRFPYQLASSSLIVLAFVSIFARDLVGNAVVTFIDSSAPILNLLLPTGWPALLFQALLPDAPWWLVISLVPVGTMLWTLPKMLARLATGYEFREPLLPTAPDLIPGDDAENRVTDSADRIQPTRAGVTTIEEMVQSRQFLAFHPWNRRGRFERVLWRWLNNRERALVDFVFPDGLNIMPPWWRIFRVLVGTCLIAVAAGLVSPVVKYWIIAGGTLVTVCLILAQVLSTGRSFEQVVLNGVTIQRYAGHAVGFLELGHLLFKCSMIQFPLVALAAVGASELVLVTNRWPPGPGVLFGIKVAGLLVMSRWVFLVFGFSSGTNDTSRLRFRSAILILMAVGFCITFVVLGGVSLFLFDKALAWVFWAGAAMVAYSFFRFYGWFYHANRFDLMRLPQP